MQKQSEAPARHGARPSEVTTRSPTLDHHVARKFRGAVNIPSPTTCNGPGPPPDTARAPSDPEDRSARSRPQVHLEANSVGVSVKKKSRSGAHLPPRGSSRLQPAPGLRALPLQTDQAPRLIGKTILSLPQRDVSRSKQPHGKQPRRAHGPCRLNQRLMGGARVGDAEKWPPRARGRKGAAQSGVTTSLGTGTAAASPSA